MQQNVYPSTRVFYALITIVMATMIGVLAFTLSAITFSVSTLMAADASAAPANNALSLQGSAWIDLDRDGSFGSDELPAVNKMIFVIPDRNDDFAQTLVLFTDADGQFLATNLTPGRYRIWAEGQDQEQAALVNVSEDRSTPTLLLPIVNYTLYVPLVAN
jgi:hypothetical protein